jgi:hypothetical protein
VTNHTLQFDAPAPAEMPDRVALEPGPDPGTPGPETHWQLTGGGHTWTSAGRGTLAAWLVWLTRNGYVLASDGQGPQFLRMLSRNGQ